MRYSMLVYIGKMSSTLLEAARYLRTAPADGMRAELLENGRRMLAQIREVLEQERSCLHSDTSLSRLAEMEPLWDACGEGLEERLEQFTRELPGQVPCQVRAVFFAELGEKWDAMASVYDYMRDDPRFDPVVVRTPVGRVVNRDGKREQEILYKDFLTPMGIPSLGYDEYDIDTDCPELAFISQPYESCTMQRFWPEEIAKHTRFVYLPYYVPDLVSPDTPQVLCELPVYRCAWKVCGFSERHYRYYSRHAANGGGNMITTGIPKLDPAFRLRDTAAEIPESWVMKVKGRTTFLWNTWYDYQHSSLPYFGKIAEWLHDHKECAVIWRPHPMTDTVTRLYYPAETYRILQENIAAAKTIPNMVYDEEASYSAAFCCSDAQISDYSSSMFQYLLLDKPVLWTLGPDDTFRRENPEFFIDWRWMEEARQAEDVLSFMERVRQGTDRKADIRKTVLARDLALADGRCGERCVEALWQAMHTEDFGDL